jgi:hypothetical protein
MTETYWGYNWDSVYDALKSVVETIEDSSAVPKQEFGNVEAGKPDNISLHSGDTVLIALGKIEKITPAMGGRGKVAHIKGYFLVYVDGENENAQRRASYLWDRLAAAIEANKTLGLGGKCKCKVDYNSPGGFRQNDKNMGTKNVPDYCAGAVLVLNIAKAREQITI